MNNQTYYDILGVNKEASLENIIEARNRLKFGHDSVPSWMWKEIDKAYDVLSNREERKKYDENIEVDSFGRTFLKNSSINEISNDLSNNSSEEKETDDTKDLQELDNKDLNNIQIDHDFKENIENTEQIDNSNDLPQSKESGKEQDLKEIPNLKSQNDNTATEIFEDIKFKLNEDAKFKDANSVMETRKRNKILKYAAIGGLAFFLNAGGVLIAGILISKYLSKKNNRPTPKLTKESYTGIISEIQTKESKLIQDSNQKLKDSIDSLLEGNYNYVNLQKHRLDYENRVELLDKIIKVRENTKIRKGQVTNSELRIKALRGQLNKAKKNLSYINKKIENKQLIDSIGIENVNFNSKLSKNLAIWNTQLQMQNKLQKIKLQGGFKSTAKNFIIDKFRNPLKEQIELEEEHKLSMH